MYLQRSKYNNRYIDGVFPNISIKSPQPNQRISYNDLNLWIVTRSCRLGYGQYYYKIYLNGELYKDSFWSDGYIKIDTQLEIGILNIKVELYYGNNLVNEDNINVIIYNSETRYLIIGNKTKKPVCNPISSSSESSSASSSQEVSCKPCHPRTSSSSNSSSSSSSSNSSGSSSSSSNSSSSSSSSSIVQAVLLHLQIVRVLLHLQIVRVVLHLQIVQVHQKKIVNPVMQSLRQILPLILQLLYLEKYIVDHVRSLLLLMLQTKKLKLKLIQMMKLKKNVVSEEVLEDHLDYQEMVV